MNSILRDHVTIGSRSIFPDYCIVIRDLRLLFPGKYHCAVLICGEIIFVNLNDLYLMLRKYFRLKVRMSALKTYGRDLDHERSKRDTDHTKYMYIQRDNEIISSHRDYPNYEYVHF